MSNINIRPDFPAVIDSSIRGTFVSCPRKAWYQYFNHWQPIGGSVHLVAGGAFASGCEVFRKSFYDKGMGFDESLGEALKAALVAYGDFEPPTYGSGANKTAEAVCQALAYYFTTYPPLTDYVQPLKLPSGNHAIEFTFAIPLDIAHPQTGDPLVYAGRNDMLATYNQMVFVLDDKTTSQLGASWPSSWNMRGQIDGYVWAAQQLGYAPSGAIIRGTSFLKSKFGTAESIQMRSKWQLARWYDQCMRDIQRMVSCWEQGEFDYNLGDACSSYGGCTYMDLCSVPDPEKWITGKFEPRQWNPLHAGGAAE